MSLKNWVHGDAAKYFDYITREQTNMLKLPRQGSAVHVVNKPYGLVLWQQRAGWVFDEHMLRDESVEHGYPSKHHDFFTSSVQVYMNPDYLPKLLHLTGSAWYDGLKRTLSVRCGTIEANIATAYLCVLLGNDEADLPPTDAKEKRKVEQYIQLDMSKRPQNDVYGNYVSKGDSSEPKVARPFVSLLKRLRTVIQKVNDAHKSELSKNTFATKK